MSSSRTPRWVFVHSSDELFGADRVLLEVLDCLPAEIRAMAAVWLPSDLEHGPFPLCEQLAARSISFEHMALPIIRRANLNPAGLQELRNRRHQLRQRLRRVRPDVLYGTTSATLPALWAADRKHTRLILHNQEVWKSAEKPLLGVLARRAHRIIAISQATASAQPRFLAKRTVIVPNTTVDQQTLATYRALNTLPSEPLRFLAAGRWTANKGFDVLLDAWGMCAPGTLAIAGSAPPIGDGLDLVGQLKTNPHAGCVTLLGQVDSIDEQINAAHVIVMPSSWPEPFGLVALEAMSAGRPVVATKVGGLGQFVNNDVGWLVNPRDPSEMAATFAAITLEDVIRKGANARKHYEAHFSHAIFKRNWRAAISPTLQVESGVTRHRPRV